MRLLRNVVVNLGVVCLLESTIHPAQAQKMIGQVKTFPIVISKSGSYKLRSNITVPDANTTAISVQADNVTIDLNGFSILGPTVCTVGSNGYVTSCTPTATGSGGYGISSWNGSTWSAATTVLNGTVQGMGRSGVVLYGQWARVERVRAVRNGSCGIEAGNGSTILSNVTSENGDTGIRGNWEASVIVGNVAEGNAGDGIEGGSVLANNAAVRNGANALFTADAAVIGNCAVHNAGDGLGVAGGEVGYTGNLFRSNTFGSVLGGGTDMGHNDCDGSTTCP